MNKAETLEIKKQFTPDRCTIDHICGCYVDHEKNKRLTFRKAFGQIPEEEMFKYLDIFQHTLAGTFGKNLISLEFPLDQEQPGGTQDFLLTLRNSRLEDDELVDEFYDKIIANYVNGENYYIIVVHAVYDIPGITNDGIEMEDASDKIYDYILCSICPVKLSKAGLGYNESKNVIEDRFRDWVVEGPTKGFLFPAFIERDMDIHNMLYFTKKPDDLQPEFVEAMFGGRAPISAPEQKDIFDAVVQSTIGEEADYDVMKNVHDNLNQMIEDHEEDPEPLELSKNDIKQHTGHGHYTRNLKHDTAKIIIERKLPSSVEMSVQEDSALYFSCTWTDSRHVYAFFFRKKRVDDLFIENKLKEKQEQGSSSEHNTEPGTEKE